MRKIDLALLDDGSAQTTASLLPAVVSSKRSTGRTQGLSPALVHVLQEVQRELGLNGTVEDGETTVGSKETAALVQKVAERAGFEIAPFERDQILAYLESEQKPFGILQELVDDPQVSDIIITDYAKISVQQGRRNLATDLTFPCCESYQAFVERLLKRAGTTLSTKKPIADGMIGSFARVHAVHRSLCESGPYLTIRLNRFSEVAVADLVEFGMAPQALFDYLQGIVRIGHTVLIVGEVSTGKTTLCRALAATVPIDESILVIEDTPEIQLEHPHVRYVRTREANTDGAGRVSPSECIRGGMRMAMNRIIFGEMRDAEAAEAFVDVCASGHPGLSTIHAKSTQEAIARLELFLGRAQKGVSAGVLTQQVSTAVQVLVNVNICKESGRRRIVEVKEVGPVADGVLRQKVMFKYQFSQGQAAWKLSNRLSSYRERLEDLEQPVQLSNYPAMLSMEMKTAYQEAAFIKRA